MTSENTNETFPVMVYVWGRLRPYRMNVELYYDSPQIMRFKVTGAKRFICLEKRMLEKPRNWKIIEQNFTFTGNPIDNTNAVDAIINQIELWINDKTGAFRVKR